MGFALTPEQWRFYEVFGLFRLAVIAQQIYYRYFHGQTTNEMFALFGPGVQILDRRIAELLAMSAILLVRHGQASCGAADYDQLSAHGARAVARAGCGARGARHHARRARRAVR